MEAINPSTFSFADSADVYVKLRLVTNVFNTLLAALCIMLNMLLVYTARRSCNTTMKSYALMIEMNAAVDIYFSVIAIIGGDATNTAKGMLFMINEGPLMRHVSDLTNAIFLGLSTSSFYSISMMPPLAFLFRFSIIATEWPMSDKALKWAFAGSLSFAHAHALLFMLFATAPSDAKPQYVQALMETPFFHADLPPFRVIDQSIPSTRPVLLFTSLVQLLQNGIVIFCGVRIFRSLKAQQHIMSQRTVSLNRKLNWALVMQALYPFIFCGFPAMLAVIFAERSISVPGLTIFENLSIFFVPVLNAMTVLLMLPCYRRIVLGLISSRFRRESSVSAAPTTFKTQSSRRAENSSRKVY